MANFQLFFSVQGTGGSPTEPDPENMVSDQDIGRPGRPVSSGLQVPSEQDTCIDVQEQFVSRGVFPSKFSSIALEEMSNTSR